MPSIVTFVAFVLVQLKVAEPPLAMLFGLTEMLAVGAAAGGGAGAAGAGCAFLWQPADISTTPRARVRSVHFIVVFNASSRARTLAHWATATCRRPVNRKTRLQIHYYTQNPLPDYFQLQFGCVLEPEKVSCTCSLPSASIVHICSWPPRVLWYTMCLPSGDHEGESFRPPSCVS